MCGRTEEFFFLYFGDNLAVEHLLPPRQHNHHQPQAKPSTLVHVSKGWVSLFRSNQKIEATRNAKMNIKTNEKNSLLIIKRNVRNRQNWQTIFIKCFELKSNYFYCCCKEYRNITIESFRWKNCLRIVIGVSGFFLGAINPKPIGNKQQTCSMFVLLQLNTPMSPIFLCAKLHL